MNRIVLPALTCVIVTAAALCAHDFWIVPNAFAVASGGTIVITGRNGTHFPTSESAVALERIDDARIIGEVGDTRITDIGIDGKSLRLRDKPMSDGEYVVAVSLTPRQQTIRPADLHRLLTREGYPEAAQHVDTTSTTDSVFYNSAKYATTVVKVGRADRGYSWRAEYPLEFVPLSDPATVRAGDVVQLRAYSKGKSLAGLAVLAQSAGDSVALHLQTDTTGVVSVPTNRAGLWHVRAVHVVPSQASGRRAYATYWGTHVFNVNDVAR